MKKLINRPQRYVDEALEGLCLAFPRDRRIGGTLRVVGRPASQTMEKLGVIACDAGGWVSVADRENYAFNRGAPNLGPRLSVLGPDGKRVARITTEPVAVDGWGQFNSPYGLAADSRGNLYVGEVSYTAWPSMFPETPRPARLRTRLKLERIANRRDA